MTNNPASSKLSAALGTNLLHRLRHDLFFRTEFVLVTLLLLACLANVAIVLLTFNQLYIDVASAVVGHIMRMISAGTLFTVESPEARAVMLESLTDTRNTYVTIIILMSIASTVLFGYIISKIALRPTKNALNSQKQFISNIAHEIRTPLSIIKANNEILLLNKKRQTEESTLLADNIEELDRISAIINNLLTINTFKHINHMNFQSLDINEIARESVDHLQKLAESKEIKIHATMEGTLNIWGNRSAVYQIVMNLIKNAINFTLPHGSVFISTKPLNSTFAEFEVQDTGIGIEREKLNRIFEPFYQVDPSRSQHKGSGGLGLAIVSELVKLHNGKISIESMPRVGTAVRVKFPRTHRLLNPDGSTAPTDNAQLNSITADFS